MTFSDFDFYIVPLYYIDNLSTLTLYPTTSLNSLILIFSMSLGFSIYKITSFSNTKCFISDLLLNCIFCLTSLVTLNRVDKIGNLYLEETVFFTLKYDVSSKFFTDRGSTLPFLVY